MYNNNPYINGTNISGILKRNKYILDESGSQPSVKLPRIQSLGRPQQDALPPLASNPQMVIGKNPNLPPPYHNYILKPSKIKTSAKPLLAQGISGERIAINSYGQYAKEGSIAGSLGIENMNLNGSIVGNNLPSTQGGSPYQASQSKKQQRKKKTIKTNNVVAERSPSMIHSES